MDEELTEQRQRFVEEFIIDLNGTQAAIRAGYSPDSAAQQASRLLTNVNIQGAIAKLKSKRSERTAVTADRIVTELAKIAFADMSDFAEWGDERIHLTDSKDLARDDSAAISEISQTCTEAGKNIKIKLHDKKGALELLGRHVALFNDKLRIEDVTDKADALEKGRQRAREAAAKPTA